MGRASVITKGRHLEIKSTPKEDCHFTVQDAHSKDATTGHSNVIICGRMPTRDAATEQYKFCLDFQRITMVARITIIKMVRPLELDKIHAKIFEARKRNIA